MVFAIAFGACSSGGDAGGDGGGGSGGGSGGSGGGVDSGGGSGGSGGRVDSGGGVDALSDSFFPFPETAKPPEGLAECMIFSPATGGGCICTLSKGGHLYQANCVGNSGPCTCAVDNVPTRTIPHDICGPRFIMECGFP